MFTLSRHVTLALETVIDIALYARSDPVKMQAITERQNVSQRYLEKIMQCLVHADILRSIRGRQGGYILARERRLITVGEIIHVFSSHNIPHQNAPIGAGNIVQLCKNIENDMIDRLNHITIAELCNMTHTRTTNTKNNPMKDFSI